MQPACRIACRARTRIDNLKLAPTDPALTDYDREHLVPYLQLLDADEEGADWREIVSA